MKGSGLLRLCSLLLVCSAAAWPWPDPLNNKGGMIVKKQADPTGSNPTETASPSDQPASDSASETITDAAETTASDGEKTGAETTSGDSAAATTGESASGSATGTDSKKSDASKTSNKASKTTKVDPRLPPGGIQMVTPAVIAGAQYYKIGDYVTFAWNYTSLSVTPSHIDVLASCSVNSETYTIAANQTVDPTGAVTWDTNDYQATGTVPLLTEKYTLIVVDADVEASAAPRAGYLGVSDQYVFGMYEPQPYTPLNQFKCATCSAALSLHERQALGSLLAMSTITIISFTWFAGGFGVFS